MTPPSAIPAFAAAEPPRPPAFPRVSELAKATVVLAAAAALGMATARLRFQVVDWGVESRDLQGNLRKSESEAAALRRDVARLKSPARLAEIAESRLGLVKLPPETVLRLPVAAQRVAAWEAALAKADRLGAGVPMDETGAMLPESFAPVAEMIRRESGMDAEASRPSGQPATRKEETTSPRDARLAIEAESANGEAVESTDSGLTEPAAEIVARRID